MDTEDNHPPEQPEDVVAAAVPGCIRIEFSGRGISDGAGYEIWRRHGDTVDWYLHKSTAEVSFDDADVKPGQYYEYKVRTLIGDSVSDFSESVVVYGK